MRLWGQTIDTQGKCTIVLWHMEEMWDKSTSGLFVCRTGIDFGDPGCLVVPECDAQVAAFGDMLSDMG